MKKSKHYSIKKKNQKITIKGTTTLQEREPDRLSHTKADPNEGVKDNRSYLTV